MSWGILLPFYKNTKSWLSIQFYADALAGIATSLCSVAGCRAHPKYESAIHMRPPRSVQHVAVLKIRASHSLSTDVLQRSAILLSLFIF